MGKNLQSNNGIHLSMFQAENMCRQLLDSIPAALCIADSNGKIIAGNAELKSLFPDRFSVGKFFLDMFEIGERPAIAKKIEQISNGEVQHAYFSTNVEYSTEKQLHVECNLSAMVADDIRLIVCRMEDRSLDIQLENSLQRTYNRLELLTDGVQDVILELSQEGLILFANKDFNGLHRSQLHSAQIATILPPETREEWLNAFKEQTNSEFKFKLRGKVGYLHYSSKLNFINQGGVFAVFTIYDETESCRKTEELIANKIILKQTLEAKDKFMSIIAHDLKAPFNALISFGQLLADTIQEGRYQRAERIINMINESTINSYNLLENLLTWSRSQQHRLEASPTSFSVSEAIIDTFDMLKAVAVSKKIDLVYENTSSQVIYADYNMIKTVLRNLVVNAVKFSYENGTIRIGYRMINGAVEIYVQDEGIGMSEEIRRSLFNKKKPVSQPGTKNEKGTGLGLLVCKEFINLHGGKIYVIAPQKTGSEFRFTIPAAVRT